MVGLGILVLRKRFLMLYAVLSAANFREDARVSVNVGWGFADISSMYSPQVLVCHFVRQERLAGDFDGRRIRSSNFFYISRWSKAKDTEKASR